MPADEGNVHRVYDMLLNYNEDKGKVLDNKWASRLVRDDGSSAIIPSEECHFP